MYVCMYIGQKLSYIDSTHKVHYHVIERCSTSSV